jgi:prolyl oligopeptidase
MHRSLIALSALALIAAAAPLAYPPASRGTVVTDYFGTKVADPYRWMEDVDSPQTTAWVAAEQKLTESYLADIPARAKIHGDLERLWNYDRVSLMARRGDVYFTMHNSGLQNQSVLEVSSSLNAPGRVLLDPNTLSKDGTVAVTSTEVTRDGKLLAYATETAGSDWETWHVRSVATGADLPDKIEWSKYSGASWLRDDSGFFYSGYDKPAAGTELKAAAGQHKLYFHRLGTPQSQDQLVYARPDHPEWTIGGTVTNDGRYLVIEAGSGSDPYVREFYRDLTAHDAVVHGLIPDSKSIYSFVDNVGARFYFTTDNDAPRSRLIALDVANPQRVSTVIPQADGALQEVHSVGGQFFGLYLVDAHSEVRAFGRDGALLRTVQLPGIGSVSGFDGYRADRDTYFTFSGFTTPAALYRYDIRSGASTLARRSQAAFDPSQYTTDQIFATSKDGTRIPIFVAYRKGLVRDGSAPTILYGYGGFDIPITPFYSPANAQWLAMGGVYAVATIRGGSEYGEAWHRAGMHANKQNVFDDFIAAAQYLIAQKITSTPKLAIKGESNGGLLVGAVETQRPELFGAALPGVGVMDMLRFDQFTAGKFWVSEYGSATASAEQFKTLLAYSPLQNVREGTVYPPTLIATADHDDRVFPAHSFKFAAAMQRAQAGPAPILLRVETRAGHGGGMPTSKIIDEVSDQYAFLTRALHMDVAP